MTKQDIIREGIGKILDIGNGDSGAAFLWCGCYEGDLGGEYPKAREMALDNILSYLHSQGVVIKVDEVSNDLAQTASESPRYIARGKDPAGVKMALVSIEKTAHVFKGFKDMGYAAVEPLVEE